MYAIEILIFISKPNKFNTEKKEEQANWKTGKGKFMQITRVEIKMHALKLNKKIYMLNTLQVMSISSFSLPYI